MAEGTKSILNALTQNDNKNWEDFKLNLTKNHLAKLLKNLKNQLDRKLYCDLELISEIDGTKYGKV